MFFDPQRFDVPVGRNRHHQQRTANQRKMHADGLAREGSATTQRFANILCFLICVFVMVNFAFALRHDFSNEGLFPIYVRFPNASCCGHELLMQGTAGTRI